MTSFFESYEITRAARERDPALYQRLDALSMTMLAVGPPQQVQAPAPQSNQRHPEIQAIIDRAIARANADLAGRRFEAAAEYDAVVSLPWPHERSEPVSAPQSTVAADDLDVADCALWGPAPLLKTLREALGV